MDHLKERFAGFYIGHHAQCGDDTFIIKPSGLLDVAKYLKFQDRYDVLMDVTAVDYRNRIPRFEVVYHFCSMVLSKRFRLKVLVSETEMEVSSLTSLWKSADWFEREVWDMFGIRFRGHPNLTRILMYESFEGHPLRKDYQVNKRQPLIGPLN